MKSAMTPKERLLRALNLNEPDRVSLLDFLDSQNLFESLTGRRPSQYEAQDAVTCAFKLGHDGVLIPFGGGAPYTQDTTQDIYIDEWGTTYRKTKYSWPVDAPIYYPIKTRNDLKRMKIPDPTIPERLNEIKTALRLVEEKIAVIGVIVGPFTITWLTMGFETISFSLYDDPKLLINVHRIANEFLIEAATRVINTGVDAICIAEDLGFRSGSFLSPSQFRKFTFPYLAELIEEIKKRAVPVILHSDGNLNLILDDLVDMGINALHPIEKDAHMDPKKIKEKYGDKICLWGGINNKVLSKGTVEDVVRETVEAMKIAVPRGGYIPASDSGDLLDTMPMENIWAMIDAVKKYGHYRDL